MKETERLMKEDSQRLKDELNTKIRSLTNLFAGGTYTPLFQIYYAYAALRLSPVKNELAC